MGFRRSTMTHSQSLSKSRRMERLFLGLILVHTYAAAFDLQISQTSVLARVGDRVALECRVSSCAGAVALSWSALRDKPIGGEISTSGFVSHLIFKNITIQHRNKVVCKATCEGRSEQKDATVEVYSLKKPLILGTGDMIPDQETEINCTVSYVFPDDRLHVQWLRNGKVMDPQPSQPLTSGDEEARQVTSVLSYTATEKDQGQTLTCRATLDFDTPVIEETSATITVQTPPRDINITGVSEVAVGQTLKLRCRCGGIPAPTLRWTGPDGSSVGEAGEDGELEVPEVTWGRAGQYHCEASNLAGRLNSSITVQVKGPPVNLTVEVFPSEILDEGQSVTLVSHVTAVPAPYKTLLRRPGGAELQSANGTFHLGHVTLKDAGPYLLEVTNQLGRRNLTFNLSIRAPPRDISITGVPEVGVGQTLKLRCRCGGIPAPTLRWTGPDGSSVGEAGEDGELEVPEVTWGRAGQYHCEASNLAGRLNTSVTVQVKGPPVNLTVEVFPSEILDEGQSVTLVSHVTAVPAPYKTLLRRPGGAELQSANGTFHLGHVTLKDAGPYLLEVTNQLGRRNLTFNLTIRAKSGSVVDSAATIAKVVVPAAGSLLILMLVVLLVRFLRRTNDSEQPGPV